MRILSLIIPVVFLLGLGCSKQEETAQDQPWLEVTTKDSLYFNYYTDTLTYTIFNVGEGFNWSVRCNDPRIKFEVASGFLPKGTSLNIRLFLDRDAMTTGYFREKFFLMINNILFQEVPVSGVHYALKAKFLDDVSFVDVVYDRNQDVMYLLEGNRSELWRYHPEEQEIDTLKLILPPAAISLNRRGTHAAVAHDGWVSLIDLMTMELEKAYPVTVNVKDLALTNDGKVIVFPHTDQQIRMIDLDTGAETAADARPHARTSNGLLDPTGNFFYRSNNYYPNAIEKYDISSGRPEFLYQKQTINRLYSNKRKIWMAEGAPLIFNESGDYYTIANEETTDLTWAGNFEVNVHFPIVSLDYSTSAQRIYVITKEPFIRTFNSDGIRSEGNIKSPEIMVPNGGGYAAFLQTIPYHGFFDSAGANFHMVVRVEHDMGKWVLTSIEVQ